MKILITGIKGFIGNNLKKKFKKNHKIFGISSRNDTFEYKRLIKKKVKPNIIFHCAGSGLVGTNLISYNTHKNKNLNSTKKLVKFIKKSRLKKIKIIFLSSQAVYGKVFSNKISEKNRVLPISDYGKTKLSAEKEILNIKGNSIIILRIFSIYGIGLKKQIIWDACEKFQKKNFEFRGNGQEKRDFLNIEDFIKLSEKIIKKKMKIGNQIFNVGSGQGTKIFTILNRIKNYFKIKSKISFLKQYGKLENQNYISSNLKVQRFFKWKPSKNLFKEINTYIKWFKKNYE